MHHRSEHIAPAHREQHTDHTQHNHHGAVLCKALPQRECGEKRSQAKHCAVDRGDSGVVGAHRAHAEPAADHVHDAQHDPDRPHPEADGTGHGIDDRLQLALYAVGEGFGAPQQRETHDVREHHGEQHGHKRPRQDREHAGREAHVQRRAQQLAEAQCTCHDDRLGEHDRHAGLAVCFDGRAAAALLGVVGGHRYPFSHFAHAGQCMAELSSCVTTTSRYVDIGAPSGIRTRMIYAIKQLDSNDYQV